MGQTSIGNILRVQWSCDHRVRTGVVGQGEYDLLYVVYVIKPLALSVCRNSDFIINFGGIGSRFLAKPRDLLTYYDK